MAESEVIKSKKPLQQGLDDGVLDYYDIMVIGRTGMGKSTTVDKLLIANLTGNQYSEASHEDTIPDYEKGTLKHGDMTMWLVSEREDETESVSLRLKNLVFFRALKDPHKEINNSRETGMAIYKATYQCELLSNESTKIRVLDVPGFFGEDAAGDEKDVEERAKTAISVSCVRFSTSKVPTILTSAVLCIFFLIKVH